MFFENVHIQNYKTIKDMQLQFSPGINLLIGDNGVGKTSILDALAVALGGFLSGVSGVSVSGIPQADIRIETERVAGASSAIKYMVPTSVDCTVDLNGEKFQWARIRETESSYTKLSSRKIAKYTAELMNETAQQLPLISYINTMRVSRTKRESTDKRLNDRRCGYMGCLDSALDSKGIKAWCLKMEMEAFHQEKPVPEYELFKNIVSGVMKQMNGLDNSLAISYSKVFEDIAYTENGVTLPISYLSAGYQSLLWMTMDFAYRLALLNPGQSDYCDSTGVVLIDELDMHLHPKWQWNILSTLESVFPKIQFIIATHSPIIISSCKNGKLIMLDHSQNISYLGNAYAYSIMDVLELKQGTYGIPEEVRRLSQQFDEEMNLEHYDEAKRILQEMKEKYGESNSEVKSAMLELELDESDNIGQD